MLNGYDQETADFYRWKEVYFQSELLRFVSTRTGIHFGIVTDLTALERGASGRIIRLKIVGEKRPYIIGKEFEIRRSLSSSHLYSSAFVVQKLSEGTVFVLHGAGWGHGVGMCQIGAAMMGEMGYNYSEILSH